MNIPKIEFISLINPQPVYNVGPLSAHHHAFRMWVNAHRVSILRCVYLGIPVQWLAVEASDHVCAIKPVIRDLLSSKMLRRSNRKLLRNFYETGQDENCSLSYSLNPSQSKRWLHLHIQKTVSLGISASTIRVIISQ